MIMSSSENGSLPKISRMPKVTMHIDTGEKKRKEEPEIPSVTKEDIEKDKKKRKKIEKVHTYENVEGGFDIPEAEMTRISKYLQAHKNTADPVHKRLTALVALSEGSSLAKVSANLGVSGSTVKEWKDRYMKRGLNGLMSMKYYRWKK